MWVFTQQGFVSIVDNRQSPGKLTVRSRDKASLEPISARTGEKILELPNRDYEYRIYITREQLADWLVDQVDHLTYSNFKSRISKTRGAVYHGACDAVWGVMHDVSDKYGASRF